MIANWLSPAVRKRVYEALGTALLIEAIWDVIPDGAEGRIVATLGALGFVMARVNVSPSEG